MNPLVTLQRLQNLDYDGFCAVVGEESTVSVRYAYHLLRRLLERVNAAEAELRATPVSDSSDAFLEDVRGRA